MPGVWADITAGFQDVSNTLTGGALSPQAMMAVAGGLVLIMILAASKRRSPAY